MSLTESAAPAHLGSGLCCLIKPCEKKTCIKTNFLLSRMLRLPLHNVQGTALVPFFVAEFQPRCPQRASVTQVPTVQDGPAGCKECSKMIFIVWAPNRNC